MSDDTGSGMDGKTARSGSAAEVLGAFLKLGLTSFGGPIAHLGYFRSEFVERRQWLDDRSYSDLVALCQFLPGPASSQVGMAPGLRRRALAAWPGFTLVALLRSRVARFGVAFSRQSAGAGAKASCVFVSGRTKDERPATCVTGR